MATKDNQDDVSSNQGQDNGSPEDGNQISALNSELERLKGQISNHFKEKKILEESNKRLIEAFKISLSILLQFVFHLSKVKRQTEGL